MMVSVVIPNYNHAPFLEERLQSIFRQKQFIDEIILLDDASTDDSLSIISRYNCDDIRVVCNKLNSGSVFSQWKLGLSMINKENLVWIAESDDVAHCDFLKELLDLFKDPQIVIAYSRSIDIDEFGKPIGLSYQNLKWANDSFIKKGSEEISDHLHKQCTIPNASAVVFRRSIVDDSFFKHGFNLCGDWYFYTRLLETGKIAYISKPLNFHRFHKNTVRSKSVKSLTILNERLLIVKETSSRYRLSNYRYVSSMVFQIDLYIAETKISDLLGDAGKRMVKLVWQYGFILFAITFFLIGKRILKRLLAFDS